MYSLMFVENCACELQIFNYDVTQKTFGRNFLRAENDSFLTVYRKTDIILVFAEENEK